MHRVVLALVLVVMVVFAATGAIADESAAQSSSPAATPIPASMEMLEFCPAEAEGDPGFDWEGSDVRPPGLPEAAVIPAAERLESEPDPERELYLVVITIPPGECMPSVAKGNQKDGAIVMVVQQGIVEYAWEPAFEGTSPIVKRGDTDSTVEDSVPPGTPQLLYPGDWITQDQEITFAYRSIGGDPAVILKAVWAVPEEEVGCAGGCR
ncbi:MAG: hypothetical protein ACRDJC_06250 [Thermomicrobiales bacterium]